MTATETDAQDEKKVEKEPITVKRWVADEKKFLKPSETKGVREEREYKGEKFFHWKFHGSEKGFVGAEPGSEITDRDGKVWVVVAKPSVVGQDGFTAYHCKLKDPPKKD